MVVNISEAELSTSYLFLSCEIVSFSRPPLCFVLKPVMHFQLYLIDFNPDSNSSFCYTIKNHIFLLGTFLVTYYCNQIANCAEELV